LKSVGIQFRRFLKKPAEHGFAPLSLAASRCTLACECCVIHEVANDVKPPIAVPARAAKADMYAASIGPYPCRYDLE
jgi:hypothetical protein